MTAAAVVGASGFVGRHLTAALEARGVAVVAVKAPRVTTAARSSAGLTSELASYEPTVSDLAATFTGVDVVINAAGQATAVGGGDDTLFGANSLLPAVVALAAARAGSRFVHVSSAAVQGRREVLDETPEVEPFSPYSASKALGEALALDQNPDTVIFRPTSVQGAERAVTQKLIGYARGPLVLVAAPGTDPTPQVDVRNVADAIAFVALATDAPRIVLQPAEGFTTSSLLVALGAKRIRTVPRWFARLAVSLLFLVGRVVPAFAGVARRLEMLWFGQRQVSGWLSDRWSNVARLEISKGKE